MKKDSLNAKDRIFQAALELIEEGAVIGGITTRQIAQKANVNLALINYYYQSKENLLGQVVQMKMGKIIEQIYENKDSDENPIIRLKRLLNTTADFSFEHNDIFKMAVSGELKKGCINSCEMVMPMLKEIHENRDESELRIIALQLMLPFHYIVLYPELFGDYLSADFFNIQQRTQKINQMTDFAINKDVTY
ncbi:MAG: TetR/AcrR family transcriptional regulator [Bacillota bacterium]